MSSRREGWPVSAQLSNLPGLQQAAYWFTLADCAMALRCSVRTVRRHLRAVPKAERVKVTRKIDGVRTTRYWRVSPAGLRVLGRLTGQAPYL